MAEIKDGSVVAFLNQGTNTCIDLTASNPKSGTPVIGYNYNGTKNQHWKLVETPWSGISVFPVYFLINQATNTALDLYNGGKENGTQLTGWAHSAASKDNTHQIWRIVNEESGLVAIQNVGTRTYVDLYNGSSANSTKITGWAGNPLVEKNTHQLWKVKVITP